MGRSSFEKQKHFAKIAQLVEHNLAKVRVAGSSPVFRSFVALVVELVDTQDLKSCNHCDCAGSSPARSTKNARNDNRFLAFYFYTIWHFPSINSKIFIRINFDKKSSTFYHINSKSYWNGWVLFLIKIN